MEKTSRTVAKSKMFATAILSLFAVVFTAIGTTFLIAKAQPSNWDIVAPETGFTRVARYEFNDPNNLGLDSWGENHLVSVGATADTANSAVNVGNGTHYLYAPALDTNNTDFSDLMKGSFSLSFRIFMSGNKGGNAYLFGTSWDTSYNFGVWQSWDKLKVKIGKQEISVAAGTGSQFADRKWSNIIMIYDATASTFTLISSSATGVATSNVTDAVNFGNTSRGVFTLGGRSTGAIGGFANAALCERNTGTKSGIKFSDFRIYSGVIDDAEIASINASYSTPADITAPETGFAKIAHYEFNDAKNLGKDSLGNFSLVNNGNATYTDNSVKVGESNSGYLYAPAIGSDNKDFSDLIKGSFSLSFRTYIKGANGATKYYMGTSWDTENSFAIKQDWNKLTFNLSNGQSLAFEGYGIPYYGGYLGWHRINVIYNETDLTLRVVATGRNNNTITYDQTKALSSAITFGGAKNGVFTIGGRSTGSAGGFAGATEHGQTISDFRIYSGAINDNEINAINKYDVDEASKKSLATNSEVIGASIRLNDNSGLRFLATLNESTVNSFVTKYGAENVEFGVKIIRYDGQYA